ncbi:PFL_4669 family integrating conjugative element protein [Delftia acidovorans]|uniref:TIGR03761 family integrating conjugative element protein n=1 Tax=Delftia acidovorans TaxID=80866 RepID=A0AAJ2R8Y9_DELAC|nr:TIGR03761 family integrating conjugative element protein [Delftia acidovorans]MDX4954693.1 TIGR03761 family integrating conjugative element protein [Delftia acidovorans]MDX4957378.1 TIGR03761 family integrating conjugative element protein [Delftia acidovorans]
MATTQAKQQNKRSSGIDAIDLQSILGARITFEKEDGSPFADGYSIRGEENVLAEYIQAGASESDPRFDRYVELLDRRERLAQMQSEHQERRGADPLVPISDAQAIDDLGMLIDDGVDQMTIHTIEALRMFYGRAREPGSKVNPIIGGRRIAASLRNLWLLTGNNNPYADWALVRYERGLQEVQEHLRGAIQQCEERMQQQRKLGLNYTVAASSNPVNVNLGFKSPYGYDISTLIVQYDYFVRLQKTLNRKSLQSDSQMRESLSIASRAILKVFYDTARFSRWLSRSEMADLNRADWIGTDVQARKRIEFAMEVFGPVPAVIYKVEVAPSHSRRRYSLTDAERTVLQQVGAQLEAEEQAQRLAEADASTDAPAEPTSSTESA